MPSAGPQKSAISETSDSTRCTCDLRVAPWKVASICDFGLRFLSPKLLSAGFLAICLHQRQEKLADCDLKRFWCANLRQLRPHLSTTTTTTTTTTITTTTKPSFIKPWAQKSLAPQQGSFQKELQDQLQAASTRSRRTNCSNQRVEELEEQNITCKGPLEDLGTSFKRTPPTTQCRTA